MNWRVFVLAAAVFTVGLVELVVGGILPNIAKELHISLAQAGQLITIFALVYAISAPVLLSMTAKVERKKLYLISLFVFTLSNVATFLSTTFLFVILVRIISAMCAALIVVLSITITTKIVAPTHRAKALSVIFAGLSSSLVIGIPIGIFITELFHWRAVFLGIAILSALSMILIYFALEKMPIDAIVPLKTQLLSLGKPKIYFAHFITLFMLAGHYTLYAYLTPFLIETHQMEPYWISVCYMVIGIASIFGNTIGGWLSDWIGTSKAILSITALFAIVLFTIPFTVSILPLFFANIVLWGGLSWALTPPLQSYLIQIAPETSDIQQSLNTSALQIGISIGSAVGAVVVATTGSVLYLATVGAILAIISFICTTISIKKASEERDTIQDQRLSS